MRDLRRPRNAKTHLPERDCVATPDELQAIDEAIESIDAGEVASAREVECAIETMVVGTALAPLPTLIWGFVSQGY